MRKRAHSLSGSSSTICSHQDQDGQCEEKQATHTNTQQEQHNTRHDKNNTTTPQHTTRQEQRHIRPHKEPPPPRT